MTKRRSVMRVLVISCFLLAATSVKCTYSRDIGTDAEESIHEDFVIDRLTEMLRSQQMEPREFPELQYRFNPVNPDAAKFAANPDDPRFYQSGPAILRHPVDFEDVSPFTGGVQLHEGHVTDYDMVGEEFSNSADVTSPQDKGDGFQRQIKAKAVQMEQITENKEGPSALAHTAHVTTLEEDTTSDLYFTALVAGCSAAAVLGVVAAGVCWYKFQKSVKAAADVEYPAYGVTGPSKDISPSSGDRRLAQSAQMYHYQHQKQQIIAMENQATTERPGSASDVDSEEENEGDYTVYECPGLAPTGEMEVKNPLFQDDPTPATPKGVARPEKE